MLLNNGCTKLSCSSLLIITLICLLTTGYYAVQAYDQIRPDDTSVLKTETASMDTSKSKNVITEDQIKSMRMVDFEKVGRVTIPFPQINVQLPHPWTVTKQFDPNTFILTKDPYRFMVPDYSDRNKKSFVLWSLIDGTSPECFIYTDTSIPTNSDGISDENTIPVIQTMSMPRHTTNPIDTRKVVKTSKKTPMSTSTNKIIADRDEEWKKELSFLFPLDGTPLQSPEEVAQFIKETLTQICEKQGK